MEVREHILVVANDVVHKVAPSPVGPEYILNEVLAVESGGVGEMLEVEGLFLGDQLLFEFLNSSHQKKKQYDAIGNKISK